MSDIYVKLFNLIFDKGLIPEQWLYGDIIPIFKNKGDKSDPKNYRPITIVSCFGKLCIIAFPFSFSLYVSIYEE
jgi:hypothetical protein